MHKPMSSMNTRLKRCSPKLALGLSRSASTPDSGHHAYRGGDPVAFMKRHRRRLSYLHFKSVGRELQKKMEVEKIPLSLAVGRGIFWESLKGAVDLIALWVSFVKSIFQAGSLLSKTCTPHPSTSPHLSPNGRDLTCRVLVWAKPSIGAPVLETSGVGTDSRYWSFVTNHEVAIVSSS